VKTLCSYSVAFSCSCFRKFLIKICFLCFFTTVPAQDEPPPADTLTEPYMKMYQEAKKLLDSGKVEPATRLLKKTIKEKKDFVEPYIRLAEISYKKNDKKDALRWLEKAEKISYRHYEVLKLKGIIFYEEKKYPLSKQYLDSAKSVSDEEKREDAELHLYRARLMHAGKANKDALKALEIALDYNPQYPEAMKLKAQIWFEQQEWKRCWVELDKIISMMKEENRDYEMYRMRAKCKYELKDYKASLSDWNILTDALPKDEEAWIMRGATKIQLNDFSSAIADLDQAIKLNPKNPVSYCYRGLAKGSNRNIPEGLKDLDYAIKLKFDYATAYVNRAALRMAAKDKQGACEDLKKAESLGNENAIKLFDKYCKTQ